MRMTLTTKRIHTKITLMFRKIRIMINLADALVYEDLLEDGATLEEIIEDENVPDSDFEENVELRLKAPLNQKLMM